MSIYNAKSIPAEARRGTLDPALAKWLPNAPALGGHETVAEMRVSHDKLLAKSLPPIGRVEYLGLQGPHGTLNVRCYHPSKDGAGKGGALVYMHGGGWTVGTLDQFEAPMRIFAEESGAQVYIVVPARARIQVPCANRGERVRCALAFQECSRARRRSRTHRALGGLGRRQHDLRHRAEAA